MRECQRKDSIQRCPVTRFNRHKVKYRKFHLNGREVVIHWYRSPREAVESSSMETLRPALSNPLYLTKP